MRFPNAGFQQLAIGKRGAIVEQGDGELLVPAVLQPLIEVSSAFFRSFTRGSGVQQASYAETLSVARAGAGVAAVIVSDSSMSGGIWRISGSMSHQFNGTTNVANATIMGLQAPDGSRSNLFASSNITPATVLMPFSYTLHFAVDGYAIFLSLPDTVAGDAMVGTICYLATRLL